MIDDARASLAPNPTTLVTDLPSDVRARLDACPPRLLRFRDAPRYLGMDRNKFNAMVRPYVTAVRLGRQALAFDRLELDAWADALLDAANANKMAIAEEWAKVKEKKGVLDSVEALRIRWARHHAIAHFKRTNYGLVSLQDGRRTARDP